MAFIPIPNVAQVAMRFTQDNQEVANVFHASYTGSPTAPLLTDIGEAFIAWWDAAMQPFVSGSVTLREVAVTDQSVQNGIGVIVTQGLPLAGGDASPQLPNNNTVTCKWNTGRTGRSFRGRTYHIGLTEAQVTANVVSNTTVTNLQTAYIALITTLNAAGFPLVVASRFSNNQPRPVGISSTVLTASVNPVVDSQRRRLPGRGR